MMRPAIGIGWLLWRQNRVGLIGLTIYLVGALTALRLLGGASYRPGQDIIAAVLLGYALLFLAGMGSLNLFSDDQNFKPYLFTLPVKTRSLVFWHMAYPMAASLAIWLVGAWFLFVPTAGYAILFWPAALIAVLTAIWQASLWYPSAWYLRPVFIVLGVAGPALLLGQAWIRDMPVERISFWMLAAVPFAIVIAVRGVELARRGQTSRGTPNLDQMGLAGVMIERGLSRSAKTLALPFRDARAAQFWLEWRTNGMILPIMVAAIYLITIPIVTLIVGAIATGFSVGDLGIGHIRTYAAFRWGFVFIPSTAFLLLSAGTSIYQGTLRRDGALEPFFATRAMTSWDLVVSKIGAAIQSSLGTWAVTLFLVGLWLLMPATDGTRHGVLGSLLLAYGPPRTALYALTGLLILILWTWRSQVCSLCIGLTGRKWLGWVAFGLFILQSAFAGYLKYHPTLAREVARLLPDPMLALAVLKPILAGFVFFLLRRKKLASISTLFKLGSGWLLVAGALSAFLIWVLPPALAPARSIISGVVLLLPIVRPSLAPLALYWNRHR